MFIIKDSRNQKTEGLASFLAGGSCTTFDPFSAKVYCSIKDAKSAAKDWKKLMNYESDLWIEILPRPVDPLKNRR